MGVAEETDRLIAADEAWFRRVAESIADGVDRELDECADVWPTVIAASDGEGLAGEAAARVMKILPRARRWTEHLRGWAAMPTAEGTIEDVDVAAILTRVADAAGLRLEGDAGIGVIGRPRSIERCIGQLVAVGASRPRTTLRIHAVAEHEQLTLVIEDDGPPMDGYTFGHVIDAETLYSEGGGPDAPRGWQRIAARQGGSACVEFDRNEAPTLRLRLALPLDGGSASSHEAALTNTRDVLARAARHLARVVPNGTGTRQIVLYSALWIAKGLPCAGDARAALERLVRLSERGREILRASGLADGPFGIPPIA